MTSDEIYELKSRGYDMLPGNLDNDLNCLIVGLLIAILEELKKSNSELDALKARVRGWADRLDTDCDNCDVDAEEVSAVCPCVYKQVIDEMREVQQ